MNYIFRTPPLIDFKNNRNTLFLLPSHITLTTQRRLHSFLVWGKFTKVSSFVGNHSIHPCLVITGYCPSETNIRHLKGGFSEKSTWLSCNDEIYKVGTIFRDSSMYYPQRTIAYQVCVAIFWPSRARLQQIITEASQRFVSFFWQPWNSTRCNI